MSVFQGGDHLMPPIGNTLTNRAPAFFMKLEHLFRMDVKSLLRGIFLPIVFAPDASLAPISGNSRFNGYSSAGEKDNLPILGRIQRLYGDVRYDITLQSNRYYLIVTRTTVTLSTPPRTSALSTNRRQRASGESSEAANSACISEALTRLDKPSVHKKK